MATVAAEDAVDLSSEINAVGSVSLCAAKRLLLSPRWRSRRRVMGVRRR